MAENTKIQWTEATWNPLAGCKEISPGCQNCYAAVMAHRLDAMGQAKYLGTTKKLPGGKVAWTGKITLDEAALTIPLRRKKPTTYFVNSMSDLFHEDVPDEFIVKVFAVILLSRRHTYQVLTKRPKRMRRIVGAPNFAKCVYDMAFGLSHEWCCGWLIDGVPEDDVLPNVWLGVSVEDQARADERIPYLLRTPAAVRWLSCEPLLGPVDLAEHFYRSIVWATNYEPDTAKPYRPPLDWVVVGGESGPDARPCDVAWVRSLVVQCRPDVACFVKQLGSKPFDGDAMRTVPGAGTILHSHAEATTPQALDTLQACLDASAVRLRDRKGGDITEFPEDLRVRQFPKAAHA